MTDLTGSRDTIVIHAVGNVGPRRTEYREPVDSLFGMVHEKIKEADISLCALERLFSTRGCLQYGDRDISDPRTDPENVKSLVFGGLNIISHATNNCFSYGPEALLDSIDVLRANGLQVIGAGKDIAEARRPVVAERRGIKAGFLGYCSVLPVEYEAREGKPGCAPARASTYFEPQGYQPGTPPKVITIPREDDALAMEDDIRKLRSQVDAVVVSVHWGLGSIREIAMYQPAIGRRAIDAGADIVLGHHGPAPMGIELYKGKAIFYCLGNFGLDRSPAAKPAPGGPPVSIRPSEIRKLQTEPGWERNPGPREGRYTMMVRCVAGRDGVRRVSFLPVYTNQRAEPEFPSRDDSRFQEVLDYVAPQCRELGTALSVEGDEVIVSRGT
ncbi:MAG: CapA family protein [Chloroflexi bacterium]|nr:CapA family protein [Chloroflexota bacterium]